MARMAVTRRRLDAKTEAARFAELLGATALGISQPLLDVFGHSPETFIYRDATRSDLVFFGLGVVLVPPFVLWLVGVLISIHAARWRRVAHAACIGLLVAIAVAQLIVAQPIGVVAVAAAVVALGVTVLVVRLAPVRMWLQLLGLLPVLSLVLFLSASSASEAVGGGELATTDATTGEQIAPIVLIVLDELPTSSIVDGGGAVDATRFPNLARFAGEATWYRNSTTVAGFTRYAVPSILTGSVPEPGPPLFTHHPNSIFRLVAGTHDLVVDEAVTRLCPRSACGDRPASSDGSDAGAGGSVEDLRALFAQAVEVWVDRVAATRSAGDSLADFEETVATLASAPSVSAEAGASSDLPTTDGPVAQLARVDAFVDALRPGDRPIAAVLHVLLPHSPWRYLSDGRAYAEPPEESLLGNGLFRDPWVAAVERQRHLLQASYADGLVGLILARLEEQDIYDDAVVAIAADHGISFGLDQNIRVFTQANAHEIAWAPLLVKAPGQREPVVDDRNIETVDIVPTLADLAGLTVPWTIDGVSARGDAAAARGDLKEVYALRDTVGTTEDTVHEVDAAEGFAAMLADAFPPLRQGADPVAALSSLSGRGDLYGAAFAPSARDDSAAPRVDDLGRLRAEPAPVLALSGALAGGAGDVTHVVAVVDDRIVGISPVIERRGGAPGFLLLLPTRVPLDLGDVRLGLLRGAQMVDTGTLRG